MSYFKRHLNFATYICSTNLLGMEKLRRQKIYSKYRSRTHDNITIPEIRLEGKWLEKLGFKEGQQIIIQQEQNKLTIMVLK
jgi:toxic protein SymE